MNDASRQVDSPGLEVLDTTQQVDVTRRVLLDDILDVVGTERLAKLSSRYKVLDFSQRPNGVLVLLRQNTELDLLLVGVLIYVTNRVVNFE